ncbi:MAG TPA: hypothetical protein VL171_15630 [Verrucomicrobiae bacterium]|nr:hypothetical protein [Verrucomicrobiae bacterium]
MNSERDDNPMTTKAAVDPSGIEPRQVDGNCRVLLLSPKGVAASLNEKRAKMPVLGMNGPFTLDAKTIDVTVTQRRPGNYALGAMASDGRFTVSYVGRSDVDVNGRLHQHVGEHRMFKFSYASSAKAAFEKECGNYHDFRPSDNKIHPGRPDGTDWQCPYCNALADSA